MSSNLNWHWQPQVSLRASARVWAQALVPWRLADGRLQQLQHAAWQPAVGFSITVAVSP